MLKSVKMTERASAPAAGRGRKFSTPTVVLPFWATEAPTAIGAGGFAAVCLQDVYERIYDFRF